MRLKCLSFEMAATTAARDKLVLYLFSGVVSQPKTSASISGSGRQGRGVGGSQGAAAAGTSPHSAANLTQGINGWFTDTANDPCGDAFPGVSCTKDKSTGESRVTM